MSGFRHPTRHGQLCCEWFARPDPSFSSRSSPSSIVHEHMPRIESHDTQSVTRRSKDHAHTWATLSLSLLLAAKTQLFILGCHLKKGILALIFRPLSHVSFHQATWCLLAAALCPISTHPRLVIKLSGASP